MSNSLEATFSYEKGNQEQTCDYCGCVFQVIALGQKGHEESEEYYCPECNKEYKTRASNSPRVSLIKPRTDGKNNKYKN